MSYENILVETKGRVGIIRLNRPQALNALNAALIAELHRAIAASRPTTTSAASSSPASEKAFAAGADIKEMAGKSFIDASSATSLPTGTGSRARASRWSRRSRASRSAAAASSRCSAT